MPLPKKKIKSFLPDEQMKNINYILKIKQKYNTSLSESSKPKSVKKTKPKPKPKPKPKSKPKTKPKSKPKSKPKPKPKSKPKSKPKNQKLYVGSRSRKIQSNNLSEQHLKDEEAEAEEPITLSKKEYSTYMSSLNFTKMADLSYVNFKDNEEFRSLVKINPSILPVNETFNKIYNKSFIAELLSEENVGFVSCFKYYLHLKKLVAEGGDGAYPIIEMLIKHGFNTIYDILLENNESFYLVAFMAHLSSFGVIENANDFLISLKTNKLHKALRNKALITQLQKDKLYTRVKRFQLAAK
jgi:hypothetical protein